MAELKDVRNDYHGVSNLTSDIDSTETNIALLAFKVAAGDSLTKFEMVDQVIDDYADETGIDIPNSSNVTVIGGAAYSVSDDGIRLLLHCEGSSFVDSGPNTHIITASGNVVTNSSYAKFGSKSGNWDQTNGQELSVAHHTDFVVGSGDWTYDFWVFFHLGMFSFGAGSRNYMWFHGANTGSNLNYGGWYYGGQLGMGIKSSSTGTVTQYSLGSASFTDQGWNHVEFARSGNTLYGFLDGDLKGTATLSSSDQTFESESQPFKILSDAGDWDNNHYCWADEFRFVKGTASHTSNFSVPTSAYTASSIVENLTLVSTATTAETTDPATGDIVMLLEDGVGTATYGSTPGTGDDLRAYASRDAGTTWSEGTLTSEGTWGTNKKILVARDIDISSQPSGQSMKYRIETYNQAVADTPKTITANGNTVTKTGIKKFGTASCYQDGTGTFDNGALSIGNSTDWDFGTGDFTIDFWLYLFQTGSNKNQKIIGCSNYSGGWQGWHLKKDHSNMNLNWEGGANTTAFNTAGSSAIVAQTWTHVALVKSGTTTKLYFDGVQKFSLAQNYAIQSTGSETLQIGGSYSDGNWEYPQMYIDEIRVSHGAHWTSDFTPWTAPYSVPSSYYKLLMHMDGADNGTTFTDDSPLLGKDTRIHATSLAWK